MQDPGKPQDSFEKWRRARRIVMTVASNALALGAAAVLIWALPEYKEGNVFDSLMMGEIAVFLMAMAIWMKPR